MGRPDPGSRQRPQVDSTIAMKGTNSLRVQGCAFGGMFCGGQTWKRVELNFRPRDFTPEIEGPVTRHRAFRVFNR